MHSSLPVPAAQYLRTSTRQQPCSIEIQKTTIQNYAINAGFVVVRSYLDVGRSGLRLSNRPGLSALLHDITRLNNDYHAVLVYDVSRWGRFQDADEAAHYEFLCKRFDVPVHYCAESFGDDQGWPAFIVKSLKRTMAGEYSRELSAKAFRGQKRLAQLGFRVGGSAGYGLGRMAISSDGLRTQLLKTGEYKSLSTDRIVLVPGPPGEVRCVRKIFTMALRGDMSFNAIAAELNGRKIPFRSGRPWRGFTIHRILTNKKYIGCNVWNQTSRRLGSAEKRNPSDQWVFVPQAFSGIVDTATFEAVQKVIPTSPRWTIEQLVSSVKELTRNSKLSERTIANAPSMPSSSTLRRRLGGLRRIPFLGCSGLKHSAWPLDVRQRSLIFRNSVLDRIGELFPKTITEFHLPGKRRTVFRLENGLVVSVIVCGRQRRKTGIMRWVFRPIVAERNFVTLICLDDIKAARYYLVPRIDSAQAQFCIGANHPLLRTGIRLSSLGELYKAATSLVRLPVC